MDREKLSAKQLRQAISLGSQMAESEALAMLALKARQVAERDRRHRVVAGPLTVCQDVVRLIKLPNGSGRIEAWEKGKGWVEAPWVTLDELMPGAGRPVSPRDVARLNIPASALV